MNIRPFVLYGLIGCPHCEQAIKFLQGRNIPGDVVIANNDPVADEGNKWVTNLKYKTTPPSEEVLQSWKASGWKDTEPYPSQYPLLVYRVTKEVIVGFQQEEYERVANHYYTLNGQQSPNVFVDGASVAPAANPVPPASTATA